MLLIYKYVYVVNPRSHKGLILCPRNDHCQQCSKMDNINYILEPFEFLENSH